MKFPEVSKDHYLKNKFNVLDGKSIAAMFFKLECSNVFFSVCKFYENFIKMIFCFHFTELKMYMQCTPDHLKISVQTQGFYLCYNCFNVERSPK